MKLKTSTKVAVLLTLFIVEGGLGAICFTVGQPLSSLAFIVGLIATALFWLSYSAYEVFRKLDRLMLFEQRAALAGYAMEAESFKVAA